MTATDVQAQVRRRRSTGHIDTRGPRGGSQIGGATGGTALVVIAQQLGTHSWPGMLLMYAAPMIAVGYSGVLMQLHMLVESTRRRSEEKEAQRKINAAHAGVEALLKNSHATEKHKRELRGVLEGIEREAANRHLGHVKALK
ncbi:hypothetical protein ACLMAJ_29410 [Nocardia sp. KC 131]|uniref:hypothetical protein n=1 Tax=Nocardia arseniciresistens TaxID=3392119 RepID=UPI00398F170B